MLNEFIHSRQWFNTLIPRSRTVGSAAYTLFIQLRLSALVELSTRCTTPDTTVETGGTRAIVEYSEANRISMKATQNKPFAHVQAHTTVCGKKVSPKVFRHFLSNRSEFLHEISNFTHLLLIHNHIKLLSSIVLFLIDKVIKFLG